MEKSYFNPYSFYKGGFIPNFIFEDKTLSNLGKLLYAKLAQHSRKNGYCWPRQRVLAEELNCTEGRIQVLLKELKEKNYIEIVRPEGKALLQHAPNKYYFILQNELKVDPSRNQDDDYEEDEDIEYQPFPENCPQPLHRKGLGAFASNVPYISNKELSNKELSNKDTTLKDKSFNEYEAEAVVSGSSSKKLNRPDRNKNPLPKKPMFADAVKGMNELFEEKTSQIIKSTSPINAPEEISILIEHWSNIGFKAPDPNKAPKGYNRTVKNLKKLMAGKLFQGNNTRYNSEDIISTMDKFSLIVFDPKYGPKQPLKDILSKKELKDFLYNPHVSGVKSWFLELVNKDIKENENIEMVEDQFPNITNKLKLFYYDYAMAGIKVRLDTRGENNFRRASNTLGRLYQQKGYKFPSVNGISELAELLCSAIRQFYGNNTSKVSPASFSSKFAVSNMIKYMNEKGYFTDGESIKHWETGF